MSEPKDLFAQALEQAFKPLLPGRGRYALLLEAAAGFQKFIHAQRLEHERFSLGERNPSLARQEGFIQAEQLADFETALADLISDVPNPDFTESLAASRLQRDEPDYYYKITRT